MARKRTAGSKAEVTTKTVTAERAARLYRLLLLLRKAPLTRDKIARRLRLGVRGFYRDLELLRESGIELDLKMGRYVVPNHDVVGRLPFPDPRLTLSEAGLLAKGRTTAHRKLKVLIAQIVK